MSMRAQLLVVALLCGCEGTIVGSGAGGAGGSGGGIAVDPAPDAGTEPYAAFLRVWKTLNPQPGASARCAACHGGTGPGKPDHAQDDPARAYTEALKVVNLDAPEQSRLYQQAKAHLPANGVTPFSATELDLILRWLALETKPPMDAGTPLPVDALLAGRTPQLALALSSAALRVGQVPAHFTELLDLDAAPDAAIARQRYELYVDRYLSPNASAIGLPLAGTVRRPGIVQNVLFHPTLWPPAATEATDTFALTSIDFDAAANRGAFHVYPSALARLPLQWIGFGGIRSSRSNPTVPNEDNFGAVDAMMRVILRDRPVREAFATNAGTANETRACLHIPYAGFSIPTMRRQVCRKNAGVDAANPTGTPVPGGLIGSRSYQRINYGHYKFHTVRSLFKNFHCTDFPVFTSAAVTGTDDAAARARVVSPWNQTGTVPYCASCHAGSNLNLMALAFWRFSDATGVQQDGIAARRPTEEPVGGATDIVAANVDASKYYYKDQVLPSFDAWVDAFVADPAFTRCAAAQIYNFAMGRGNAATPEHRVPAEKVTALLADYEAAYGAGSTADLTVLKTLSVVFKSRDFTDR